MVEEEAAEQVFRKTCRSSAQRSAALRWDNEDPHPTSDLAGRAVVYRRRLNITFWQFVDPQLQPLPSPVPWLDWVKHIEGLNPAENRLVASNGDRYGRVDWRNDREIADAYEAMLTIAKNRIVWPSRTNIKTGDISELHLDDDEEVSERLVGVGFPSTNTLALSIIGQAAPRPPSFMQYVNEKCELNPPLHIVPIPKPSLVEMLSTERNAVVAELELEAHVAGLRELAAKRSNGFMGLTKAASSTALDAMTAKLVFALETNKRAYNTMQKSHRNVGVEALKEAHWIADEGREYIDHAVFKVYDEDEGVVEVVLGEELLATTAYLPIPKGVRWVKPEVVHEAMIDKHREMESHIKKIVTPISDT